MAGEYNQLVIAAQADTDQAHRQRAMDAIALIAPHSGAAADTMAAPMLTALYPPDGTPAPGADEAVQQQLAEITAEAARRAEAFTQAAVADGHVHGHPAS